MGVLSNNYAQIVPGALISASYISDIYDVLMGSEPENIILSGSLTITGSVISTYGFTGSLSGTSSYAITSSRAISALTASYAISASYINYINSSSQADSAVTASYALTSSYIPTYINTASISSNAITFTKGNGDQFNIILPANSVNYSNVLFVDQINGNDASGSVNDFTKSYQTIGAAIADATSSLSPTSFDRILIYVRRGAYSDEAMIMSNYIDIYCEPGVYLSGNSYVTDNDVSLDFKFLGYSKFDNNSAVKVFKVTGNTTDAVFECDEITAIGGAFEAQNGSNVVFKARRIFTTTLSFGEGIFNSGAGNRVIEITEKYESDHQNFKFADFTGNAYITCPKIYLASTNVYGGNYKQCVFIEAGSGTGCNIIINGNLYCNSTAGYYSGISAAITRWGTSLGTFTLNGNIYAENQLAINAQGSNTLSRTIINGNISTNLQIAYIASNSTVIFKNGILINNNTTDQSVSNKYPLIHVNQNSTTYVENCHLYNFGTGSYSAIWKTSTTSQLNVYNSVYSGQDASGSFVKNTASGTPTNNVRLHNVRSTKSLDTNIVDLLSPTGFIQDSNIISINFI